MNKKILNKKYTFDSPFFVHLRKHYCPNCQSLLLVKRIRTVVNSKSEEAKNFDFSSATGDFDLKGNVEFIYEVFFCSSCKKDFSIKEIKKYERGKKANNN